MLTPTNTLHCRLCMRVVDCLGCGGRARDVVNWAKYIGFEVKNDVHNGKQSGCECSNLAAWFSAIMLAKLDGGEWLEVPLACELERSRQGAVSEERRILIANDNLCLFNDVDSYQTHFLSGSQVDKLVHNRFEESGVDHGCHAPKTMSFNQTIQCIAECVHDAVKKRVSTQKCIISNTDTDAGTGLHWFTVLFDIDADPK